MIFLEFSAGEYVESSGLYRTIATPIKMQQIRIQFSEQHRGPIPLDDFEDEGNADTRLDKDEDYRRLRAYLNQRQRL